MSETLGDRVTRLEVLFENLGKQIGRELEVASGVHASIDAAVEKLTVIVGDQQKRIAGIELRLAWVAGAIGVAIFLSTLLAPVLRGLLGLPS